MHVSDFSLQRPDRARLAAATALALLVTGCAATSSALLPEIDNWESRTAVLGELKHWQFSGRIAVKTDADGFNGKLRWTQNDDDYSASVSGPIGIGTVRIEGDAHSAIMTDKDGTRTRLEDAELEFRHRYGWTIPIDSLRFWALGIPDPATPAETIVDDAGLLQSLSQRGWAVSVSRYRDGGGQLMPARLTAENADTRVRLVIDRWVFFP